MVELIAEIGQAHEGSLGIAHSYIDALAECGINTVKFQTHIAEAESSIHEPFRVNFSYQDRTRYDYWKRMEFSESQWKGLMEHCHQVGLEFLSSPFSLAAVDLLDNIGVNRFKIGSGEVSNLLLLERIAQTGKPVILSSGMSSFAELKNACDFLKARDVSYSVMQCTTSYPTQPEQWGLNVIQQMRDDFGVPVGFSDHSGDVYACLAATALGASILEFHVVFDKKMFGPDAKASLTLDQVKMLTKGVREIEIALAHPIEKNDQTGFLELKRIFGKSLAINKNLTKGHRLSVGDLEAKKPAGIGIKASEFQRVIGRTINKDLIAYSFLRDEDLA